MRAAALGWLGFGLALVAAPFAALADAPFSEGGVEALPAGWAAFWEAFGPALTFASPGVVLGVWQFVVGLALGLVVFAARGLPTAARARSPWAARLTAVALALLAVHGAGAAVEGAGLLFGPLANVGFALYLPTLFLAPFVASIAGVVVLARGGLSRHAGWGLALAPIALVMAMIAFTQFPGGTAPGLALPWALALSAARSEAASPELGR